MFVFATLVILLTVVGFKTNVGSIDESGVAETEEKEIRSVDTVDFDDSMSRVAVLDKVKSAKNETTVDEITEVEAESEEPEDVVLKETESVDKKETSQPKTVVSAKKTEEPVKQKEVVQSKPKEEKKEPVAKPVEPVKEKEEKPVVVDASVRRDLSIQMFDSINNERSNAGLSKLAWSEAHYNAAVIRSKEIVQSFSHTRPNGTKWNTVNASILHGENIAKGHRSVEKAMIGFMNSPGHKANILLSDFTKGGVAVIEDNKILYYVQLFGY